MARSVELIEFLKSPGVIFDVRSPGEFLQGRIPGSESLPLFTNAERAIIGTTYKQVGRRQAVVEGLDIVAPKQSHFIKQAEALIKEGFAKVNCWRGGMRSSYMAMLLDMAGFPTMTLKGGYKTYRRWSLETLKKPLQVKMLGGMTGTGKTSVLKALQQSGEQVLDLENLAKHRGSSFGMLGMPQQPSTEQFENEIALQWAAFDPSKPVWIEDESRLIGTCKIPDPIHKAMRNAPLYIMERAMEERLVRLESDYWVLGTDLLIQGTKRLTKRLGGARTKEIVGLFERGKFREATLLLLEYYDTTYRHGISKRKQDVHSISCIGLSDKEWAEKLRG